MIDTWHCGRPQASLGPNGLSLIMSSCIAKLWSKCYVSNAFCLLVSVIICKLPKCYYWNSTFTHLSGDRICSNRQICTKIGMLVENMFLHICVHFEQYLSSQKKVMRCQKMFPYFFCALYLDSCFWLIPI